MKNSLEPPGLPHADVIAPTPSRQKKLMSKSSRATASGSQSESIDDESSMVRTIFGGALFWMPMGSLASGIRPAAYAGVSNGANAISAESSAASQRRNDFCQRG